LTGAKLTSETLAGLEHEKVGLMEQLAEVAKVQKGLQSEVRRVEREQKTVLKSVEGYAVSGNRELTLADVEAWCRSEFFIMAHTAPQNPHCYYARKKVRDPRMYERVVAYVLKNGYPQRYGGDEYTVLDVELNDTRWFLWPMTTEPAKSEVLNLKPDSMRPEA
jgi:hypothetical protein